MEEADFLARRQLQNILRAERQAVRSGHNRTVRNAISGYVLLELRLHSRARPMKSIEADRPFVVFQGMR